MAMMTTVTFAFLMAMIPIISSWRMGWISG